MKVIRYSIFAIYLFSSLRGFTDQIPVHHLEGVTFGFLVMRNLEGRIIAHGTLKQVVKPGEPIVTDDLQFHFEDGSIYRDITRFTQRRAFKLISDQVTQKGPSFKHDSQSWVDVAKGTVTVRTLENGKDKQTTKQMRIPPDVANGLLFVLVKNMDPSAPETTVSMIAPSDKPRIVKLVFRPDEEKTVKIGRLDLKAQQYVMKVKIEGAAGKIAPLIGKEPPEAHFWILKSEAPTFIEFEGPLTEDSPVWRIELATPEPNTWRKSKGAACAAPH